MDTVKINEIEYRFRCVFATSSKYPNSSKPAIHCELEIQRKIDNNWELLQWNDFKNSYLSEKISDYIKNTINGQRTFYL